MTSIAHRMIQRPAACAALWLVLGVVSVQAQIDEEARLLALGRITSDVLGYGLDFDGTTVIAGAPFGTYGGFVQPGRAFVFFEVDGEWQQQRLIPPRIQTNGFFGAGVAVDGDTMAVGAFGERDAQGNERAGAVYIYEHIDDAWEQTVRLEGTDRNTFDHFGVRLALQGDTLLVGANGADDENGTSRGAVYVFERVEGDWIRVNRILAPDGAEFDNFGLSVALDGNIGLIGAHRAEVDDVEDAGAAYVIRRIEGMWEVDGKLTPDDPQFRGNFGYALSVDNSTAAVIATSTDQGSGAAYVYDVSGEATLIDRLVYDGLGVGGGVSIEGDTILAGAFLVNGGLGEAVVFRRDAGTWQFEQAFLPATDRGRLNFGWRVSLSGDRAAVAGPFHTTNVGAVYMFRGLGAGGCARDPEWLCDGDVDGDGQVNPVDSGLVQAAFGSADEQDVCNYDVDCDGQINPVDSGIVQSLFGTCEEPRETCP